MRKLTALAAICAIVAIYSCSKKTSSDYVLTYPVNPQADVVLSANVSPGKIFTLNLGNAGNANIIKQAAHYSLSEASQDESGTYYYRYSPAADFKGTDEVSVMYSSAASGSSGCSGGGSTESGSHTTFFTIKINVAD